MQPIVFVDYEDRSDKRTEEIVLIVHVEVLGDDNVTLGQLASLHNVAHRSLLDQLYDSGVGDNNFVIWTSDRDNPYVVPIAKIEAAFQQAFDGDEWEHTCQPRGKTEEQRAGKWSFEIEFPLDAHIERSE